MKLKNYLRFPTALHANVISNKYGPQQENQGTYYSPTTCKDTSIIYVLNGTNNDTQLYHQCQVYLPQ